jgi:hypothetical protein
VDDCGRGKGCLADDEVGEAGDDDVIVMDDTEAGEGAGDDGQGRG